jgi:hypothetical protein
MLKKYFENVVGSSPDGGGLHVGAEQALILSRGRKLRSPDTG